ncbi:MAG TPA: class I SAM-dependent methyltransferase [Terriglobales bacterium]|nr:class I SAM-dependent methyltransferase [Terriglobales bacterium]
MLRLVRALLANARNVKGEWLSSRQEGVRAMGLYGKYLLPRIIDLAMKNKESARLRAEWIPQARGNVLEVGIGSGLNLPFYPPEVHHVVGVDPSVELQRMASKRVAAGPIKVEFLAQSAEDRLPLEDASMDTVVMAWTLCSISNAAKALQQLRRVLKADGRLIFMEHGRAPERNVAAWQDRLTPVWKHATGGCHLNRQVDQLIALAGFRIVELTTSYLPGPRPMTYTYQGMAEPA